MAQPNHQRTRRTIKACVICHKKKVRCDIDEVEGDRCTPCVRDNYECVPRERKRKRFTFSPSPPTHHGRIKTQDGASSIPESVTENFALDHAGNGSSSERRSSVLASNGAAVLADQELKSEVDFGRRLSSTASLQETPLLERQLDPTLNSTYGSIPPSMAEANYRPRNSVSYLGRLEYLRGDVPVDDDSELPSKVPHRLSATDIEILRVQQVTELPPRAVRESLLDAFWTRCYPWTPVVDRSWIDERSPGTTSLLLQHAIFLAGSRVSAAVPNYPSEDFYKKARLLFWMGAEDDPIINIASACLLQWWNPEGPERVSLDTSSFWVRVCIGLAYQVGLHREPNGKPDAGLRRRIWWSLVTRDCLINAGHGRPRAVDLKLADVSPISVVDFDGVAASANLFASYVGISCILGDLTQSYLRKQGLQEQKRSLEDRLFRWIKTLPDHLQLCRDVEGRPLKSYNFEARQLHVQYFTVLIILNRPLDPKLAPSTASLLASSYIAGIFEDFMARDELRYLGPIFTFYCLTAGMAQLSCYRYSEMVSLAEQNLNILARALEELSKRWPTAIGSLKHLMDIREKATQRPHFGPFPDISLPCTTAQFFSDFGPDLCRMWHLIHQRLPQAANFAPRDLEMAGILHGLRTPNNHHLDLEIPTDVAAHRLMNSQIPTGASLEPTLLQPQEWFGPYAMGNWLMTDWDQGGLGWYIDSEYQLTLQAIIDPFNPIVIMTLGPYNNLRVDRHDRVYVITMQKAPENRLNVKFAQEIIRALRDIEIELGPDSDGCVIIRGNDEKFWCTGLELDESDTNPHANSDGFFPLLATLLDYPFPTIALLTGHTFGGACPFALSHDYRIMNSKRGFFSMPPVNLGLHFPGIGYLPRLKLRPQVARKMLLEAHKWTGKEALEDGIVDEIADPKEMLDVALKKAREIQGKSKMGVYSVLRNELWGEAAEKIRGICYVHGKLTTAPAKAKI